MSAPAIDHGQVRHVVSARSMPAFRRAVAEQRAAGDPLYYASVRLQNIISGSRYMLLDAGSGALLASGTAAGSEALLSNVPAYSASMLIECRVRYASGIPRYVPFTGYAYHARSVISIWVSQVEDPIT